jgi:formyltetrahydrofolate synthetase
MSDIEIARAATKKPIQEIGAKLGRGGRRNSDRLLRWIA